MQFSADGWMQDQLEVLSQKDGLILRNGWKKDLLWKIKNDNRIDTDYSKGHATIEIRDYPSNKLSIILKNEFTVQNVNCALSSNCLIRHNNYGE